VKVHIKEHPALFHRFDVLWTPTVVILDTEGKERYRNEGYLPREEFMAQLDLAIARVAFVKKKFADAENLYKAVIEKHAGTAAAPEAIYWAAVCHYKATNDHTALGGVPEKLKGKYGDTIWAKKAIPFQH
jgi:hypothetical protein